MTFKRITPIESRAASWGDIYDKLTDAYAEIDRLTDELIKSGLSDTRGLVRFMQENERLKVELHSERQDCVKRGIERDEARKELDQLKNNHLRVMLTAQAQIDSQQAQIDSLERDIEARAKDIVSLCRERGELNFEIDQLKTLNQNQASTIAEMRRLEAVGAEEIESLNRVVAALDNDLNAKDNSLASAQDEIDRLRRLSQMSKTDVPAFERGKDYRNRQGEIRKNLQPCDNEEYRWSDNRGRTYTADGRYNHTSKASGPYDLILPSVDPPPTWVPPMSVKPAVYKWNDSALSKVGGTDEEYVSVVSSWASIFLHDWTDPPCVGIWEVTGPGVAVYRGPVK